MLRVLGTLAREPLVHFVALGALVFGVTWRAEAPDVRVTDAAVTTLERDLVARLGRALTPEERASVEAQALDDEALYREALALGLDRDDPVIRRRLIEKARLLLTPPPRAPSESPPSGRLTSFEHVYVRSGEPASSRVPGLLAALHAGVTPSTLGDPFAHGQRLMARSDPQLVHQLGAQFTEGLAALPMGVWSGPITSTYGVHLVRVLARVGAPVANRDVATEDARSEYRAAEAAALTELRERHGVRR